MTPALETPRLSKLPWSTIVWFGVLLVVAYFPVLRHLIRQCYRDPDMGHAFFVPVISGFIIWQRREELAALKTKPDWRGLFLVAWGGAQLILATLGTELFSGAAASVTPLGGVVWTPRGIGILKKLGFPVFPPVFNNGIPAERPNH